MEWKVVAALLAGYGLLKEIRPSEPYIAAFLTGPDKNFTEEQVNQEIFPVSTYSMLALSVVIFLVTDFLRYKPVIVVQSLSCVACYTILALGQGVPIMQVLEVLYGLMWAADVAYFTYMYAKVDRAHYGVVSATARMGYLLGRCSSGVVSQVAVSFNLLTLLDLQYFTLGVSVAATLFAIALPGVKTSVYFHAASAPKAGSASPITADVEAVKGPTDGANERQEKPVAEATPSAGVEPTPSLAQVARLLWSDCKEAYSQVYVVKWSLWWAFATGGQMMVLSYVQILWQATLRESGSNETLWNGASEAVYTLLGAGAVWLTTRKKDYFAVGDALVGVWSLAAGAIIMLASRSRSMTVQYAVYTVFAISYQAAITIASSEVAKRVREDAHGLVFGINTLGGLLMQTVLTVAVAGQGGLELDIRTQFTIYGSYFVVIGLTFLVLFVIAQITRCRTSAANRVAM